MYSGSVGGTYTLSKTIISKQSLNKDISCLHTALRSSMGHYYFARGAPGQQYMAGGSRFSYSLKQADPHPIESLTATGPLLEDVVVEVIQPELHVFNIVHCCKLSTDCSFILPAKVHLGVGL